MPAGFLNGGLAVQHERHPPVALAPVGPSTPATPFATIDRLTARQWIRSPTWDFVWILNAFWMIPVVVFLAWGHDDARASLVDQLFFLLAVPLWFGHRVSSAWLSYATPGYRAVLVTQRWRFVVIPLLIAFACFAVLLAPEDVFPMPLEERVVWLAVLDYAFLSYHFAAQHFGLLSLYRARAGRASDASTRRLDRGFALVVGGGFAVLANALTGSIAFQDRWIDLLLGDDWGETFASVARDGSILLVVIMTALLLWTELRSGRPSPPRIAYVVGMSATVVVGLLALDPFLFLVIWNVQHWSAAMGLTSLAASRGDHEPVSRSQRLLAPINQRGWAVLLALAVISALLLPVLEVEAVTDDYVYADRIFGQVAIWLRSSPFVPALLALGFATGFIHYVLDRAAFRFSSPEVRQAARGLLK
jgi:hypothetical protein